MIEYLLNKFLPGNLLLFIRLNKMVSLMLPITIVTVFVDLLLFIVYFEHFGIHVDRTKLVISEIVMLPVLIVLVLFKGFGVFSIGVIGWFVVIEFYLRL